jgi:hypothetical protein
VTPPTPRSLHFDLSAFARAAASPLADFQVRALTLETRITAIVAPRQSGKSRSLAVLALWWAYRNRGQRILIVSAGEEGSRRLLAEVRRIAQGSDLLRGSVVDEQAGLLTLSNGSEIRSVPASERQVRGWAVDLLLCDEAALISDDLLLSAAFPTTAARADARIVLASSATTAAGAFYDHAVLGETGSEHVRTFRWSLTECPWISPSAIAAARESMSELRFQAEYEGRFAGSADSLFPRHVLERATVDYTPDMMEGAGGLARGLAGVDWATTTDRCAKVVIARLAIPGRRVFGIRYARAWPQGALLHQVADEIVASPVHLHILSADGTGMGAPINQYMFPRYAGRAYDAGGGRVPAQHLVVVEDSVYSLDSPRWAKGRPRGRTAGFVTDKRSIVFTSALKAAGYSALRLAIDRGELLIPAAAEDLRRELLMLKVDLSPTGQERIQASGTGHDDLCDALMLACAPYKREGSPQWKTWLADLLNPASTLPEPMLPAGMARVDHVPGPDGLLVPRRPCWQSVAGSELSLPANLDTTDPALSDLRQQVREALSTTTTRSSP